MAISSRAASRSLASEGISHSFGEILVGLRFHWRVDGFQSHVKDGFAAFEIFFGVVVWEAGFDGVFEAGASAGEDFFKAWEGAAASENDFRVFSASVFERFVVHGSVKVKDDEVAFAGGFVGSFFWEEGVIFEEVGDHGVHVFIVNGCGGFDEGEFIEVRRGDFGGGFYSDCHFEGASALDDIFGLGLERGVGREGGAEVIFLDDALRDSEASFSMAFTSAAIRSPNRCRMIWSEAFPFRKPGSRISGFVLLIWDCIWASISAAGISTE